MVSLPADLFRVNPFGELPNPETGSFTGKLPATKLDATA